MEYLQVKLIVQSKTGVLSFIMKTGGKLGLIYNKKIESDKDGELEMRVYFAPNRGVELQNLKALDISDAFKQHSGIKSIVDISIIDKRDTMTNQMQRARALEL